MKNSWKEGKKVSSIKRISTISQVCTAPESRSKYTTMKIIRIWILQCPDGFLSDSQQSRGTGHDEDQKTEENMDREVRRSKVGCKTRKQEGDQSGNPLKIITNKNLFLQEVPHSTPIEVFIKKFQVQYFWVVIIQLKFGFSNCTLNPWCRTICTAKKILALNKLYIKTSKKGLTIFWGTVILKLSTKWIQIWLVTLSNSYYVRYLNWSTR